MTGSVEVNGTVVDTTLNNAPVIVTTPTTTAILNYEYNYDVTATDSENQTLTYELTTNPSGMIINSVSGLISWTPSSDTGSVDVEVKVSDSAGSYTTQVLFLTLFDTKNLTLFDQN